MTTTPDTSWNDDEIVMTEFTPDTDYVFARMTEATLDAVDARPGDHILDVACGRAIDALALAKKGATLFGIEASATMIEKARDFMGADKDLVILSRSLAEDLPFADNSFDKVVCKGAMDHFADLDLSMAEMARVTKPGGKIILAIANFESLTSRLGRTLWGPPRHLLGKPPGDRAFWDPPEDHNFKFDLPVLRGLLARHCTIERIEGLSLLWGFPKWGAVLKKLPSSPVNFVLKSLDAGAHIAPRLSDVLIATARPRKQ